MLGWRYAVDTWHHPGQEIWDWRAKFACGTCGSNNERKVGARRRERGERKSWGSRRR
ncbi:hypothetical protein C8Q79DRAFT_979031 [Trametes meyenii]|nr:hypothetical protein C8Q79DRAFT_979031 [Trametes meyenii]